MPIGHERGQGMDLTMFIRPREEAWDCPFFFPFPCPFPAFSKPREIQGRDGQVSIKAASCKQWQNEHGTRKSSNGGGSEKLLIGGWGLLSGIGGYLIDNFGYSIYRYSLPLALCPALHLSLLSCVYHR